MSYGWWVIFKSYPIYIHIYIISSFRHRFVSHAISPLESRFIWVQEMVQFSVHPKTLIPWQFQFSPWKLVMGKLARLYSMDCFLRLKSLENSSIFHPYFIHISSICHPYFIHSSSIYHPYIIHISSGKMLENPAPVSDPSPSSASPRPGATCYPSRRH